MGIWIDPHANFGDPAFVSQAKAAVEEVLAYSKDFENIIAYFRSAMLIILGKKQEALLNSICLILKRAKNLIVKVWELFLQVRFLMFPLFKKYLYVTCFSK